jgi:hypothetical protein
MANPLFATREEWLETRRCIGIGASEVACLFSRPDNPLKGLSSWDSPLSLSWRKRGIIGPKERDDDEAEQFARLNKPRPLAADEDAAAEERPGGGRRRRSGWTRSW